MKDKLEEIIDGTVETIPTREELEGDEENDDDENEIGYDPDPDKSARELWNQR